MRLDPKKVRFVPALIPLGLRGETLRFVGRENTVDLQETALVVEGNLLKAGLLGIELFFRRALAEWSAVTIPYARITAVRYVRFPLIRLVALALLVLGVAVPALVISKNPDTAPEVATAALGPFLLALYVSLRVPARYVVRFRTRDGRRTKLMLHVRSKKLRAEFVRRLQENREAAARFADRGRGAGPDPLAVRQSRTPVWLVAFAVLFLLVAGVLSVLMLGAASELFSRPGGVYGPPAGTDDYDPSAGLGPEPGRKAAPKAVPVADINPETIRAGLLGQTFAFRPGPAAEAKFWRVDPGEVRDLEVVGTQPLGDKLRRVHVRVTLEGGNQRLRGVLTLLYMRQAGGWVLAATVAKDGPDGKPLPFEVTDLK